MHAMFSYKSGEVIFEMLTLNNLYNFYLLINTINLFNWCIYIYFHNTLLLTMGKYIICFSDESIFIYKYQLCMSVYYNFVLRDWRKLYNGNKIQQIYSRI